MVPPFPSVIYFELMIINDIQEEIKKAMRKKNTLKRDTLRGVIASFTNELVAKGIKPTEIISDEMAEQVLIREAKKRRDSIEQFSNGNRTDLAKKEEEELSYLEPYLPDQMSEEEIKNFVEKKKAKLGVEDKEKMGVLMGAVMGELSGRADGAVVKKIVSASFD